MFSSSSTARLGRGFDFYTIVNRKPVDAGQTKTALQLYKDNIQNASTDFKGEPANSILMRLYADIKKLGGDDELIPGLRSEDIRVGKNLAQNTRAMAHDPTEANREKAEDEILDTLGVQHSDDLKTALMSLKVVVLASKSKNANSMTTPMKNRTTTVKSKNTQMIWWDNLDSDDEEMVAHDDIYHQEEPTCAEMDKRAVVPEYGSEKGEITKFTTEKSSTAMETFAWMAKLFLDYLMNQLQIGGSRITGQDSKREEAVDMVSQISLILRTDPKGTNPTTVGDLAATTTLKKEAETTVPKSLRSHLFLNGLAQHLTQVMCRVRRLGYSGVSNGRENMELITDMGKVLSGNIAFNVNNLEDPQHIEDIKDDIKAVLLRTYGYINSIKKNFDETQTISATTEAVGEAAFRLCQPFYDQDALQSIQHKQSQVGDTRPPSSSFGTSSSSLGSSTVPQEGGSFNGTEWKLLKTLPDGTKVYMKDATVAENIRTGNLFGVQVCGNHTDNSVCVSPMWNRGEKFNFEKCCRTPICVICNGDMHQGFRCDHDQSTEEQRKAAAIGSGSFKPTFKFFIENRNSGGRGSYSSGGRGNSGGGRGNSGGGRGSYYSGRGRGNSNAAVANSNAATNAGDTTLTTKQMRSAKVRETKRKMQNIMGSPSQKISNKQAKDFEKEQIVLARKLISGQTDSDTSVSFSTIKVKISHRSINANSATGEIEFTKNTLIGFFNLETKDGKSITIAAQNDEGSQLPMVVNKAFIDRTIGINGLGDPIRKLPVNLTNDAESKIGTVNTTYPIMISFPRFSDDQQRGKATIKLEAILLTTDMSTEPHCTLGLAFKERHQLLQVGSDIAVLRADDGTKCYMKLALSEDTGSQLKDEKKKELADYTLSKEELTEKINNSL
jgi:hypothetical protein